MALRSRIHPPAGDFARSGFVGIEKLTDIEIGQIKTALEREMLHTWRSHLRLNFVDDGWAPGSLMSRP